MRNIQLFAAVLVAASSFAANAADGTITFNGEVTDKTCAVQASTSKDFAVTLPTVSATSLAAAGQVAGRTSFSINLSACSAGNVATYFEPGPTVALGRLKNMAATSAAKNVDLQLLNDSASPLTIANVSPGGLQAGSSWVAVPAGGGTNLNYFVEYYATAPAVAGAVTSSVKYTIIYN